MQISFSVPKLYCPSFTSTKRTTYFKNDKGVYTLPTYDVHEIMASQNSDVKVVSSNSTFFFRNDLNWKEIGYDINSQFPPTKVNTYVFGCSDGSEPYSLAVALIEQLGYETAKKYFPIHAGDIDSQMIKEAKSGKIRATNDDIIQFLKIAGSRELDKYFSSEKIGQNSYELTMSDLLRDNIIFTQEDIADGFDNVQKSTNLILCRNLWKYLSPHKIAELTWKMHKNLDETSRVLIGTFDKKRGASPYFFDGIGFYPVLQDYDFMNGNMLKPSPKEFFKPLQDKKAWVDYVIKKYPNYKLDYIYEKRSN